MSGWGPGGRSAPRAGLEAVRALARLEPGRPDLAKGIRAGLAMGGTLAVGAAAGGVTSALLACLGAVNCIMADTLDVFPPRRAGGLTLAVTVNAGTFTLGLLVGGHLWSALVVMAPITFLAGMAGLAGAEGSAIGLTSAVVYLVGLGLAGNGTDPGLAFLEMLAGGVATVPIMVVRIPPDLFAPARRAVDGALGAVAAVYEAVAAAARREDGQPTGRGLGLARVARQRVRAARQVLAGYGSSVGRPGEGRRLGVGVEFAAALLARSEPLAYLVELLRRQPDAGPALGTVATMADGVAGALRNRATGPGGPVADSAPSEVETALGVLDREAAELHRQEAESGRARVVRRALDTLAVIRTTQDVGWGIVGLWRDPPDARPAVRAGFRAAAPALWARFRRSLSPRSGLGRRSMQFAVTAIVGYAIGEQLGLDKAYWVTLTIAVILQPAAAPSLQRAFLRVSGTVAGSLLGAVLLAGVHSRDALMVLIGVLGAASFALMRINYGLGVTFLTPLILLIVSLPHPGDWPLALTRVEATALGAGLVITSGAILWPGAARLRIARELASGLSAERRYLEAAWAVMVRQRYRDSRPLADLRREAAREVDNAEEDLDRWLGDVPRQRDQLGLLWSLIEVTRTIHIEVSTIADRAVSTGGHDPPAEFGLAVRALGDGLQRLADALAGSGELGAEGTEAEEALRQADRGMERLAGARTDELLAGRNDPSDTGRAVHELGVIDLTLQRLGDALEEAEADVRAVRAG